MGVIVVVVCMFITNSFKVVVYSDCHGCVGCDLSFVIYWMTSASKPGRVRALAPCQVVLCDCVTCFRITDISRQATDMFEHVS